MHRDLAGRIGPATIRRSFSRSWQRTPFANFSLLALFACLAWPELAAAHALLVECRLQGDRVEVRAVFDDGTRPVGAKVRVLDEVGNEIATGTTGQDGLWQFGKPPPGQYRVVVDAGAGHRSQTTITIGSVMPPEGRISSGPSEEEFTRFKGVQIVIGLSLIVAFCCLLWLIHRWKKNRSQAPTENLPS